MDKLQARLIAGRIIPALATTTSMVTGFVCIEMIKYLQNPQNSFKDLQVVKEVKQVKQVKKVFSEPREPHTHTHTHTHTHKHTHTHTGEPGAADVHADRPGSSSKVSTAHH